MNRDESLYINAINGVYINNDFRHYIPKRYAITTNNGEDCKFDLANFIEDYSGGFRLKVNVLSALYDVLLFGSEIKKLYEGFDPRCKAKIGYDECEKRYIENKAKSRVITPPLIDASKNISEWLNSEMSDIIDFGILHSIGCASYAVQKILIKSNIIDKDCFIPKQKMEEMTEENMKNKLFEIIKILSK